MGANDVLVEGDAQAGTLRQGEVTIDDDGAAFNGLSGRIAREAGVGAPPEDFLGGEVVNVFQQDDVREGCGQVEGGGGRDRSGLVAERDLDGMGLGHRGDLLLLREAAAARQVGLDEVAGQSTEELPAVGAMAQALPGRDGDADLARGPRKR